ncbi:MAG TPA: ATP synthase F1 subunit delta [Acidimicrobiia bacterium]|jgi:F-type H+-transporting ATPase subunit delta
MAETDRIEGYAAALFELARGEGALEKVERELFTVARSLSTSGELRDALTNPQLGLERKQAIIDDLIGGRAAELTVGIVSLIVGQGRAGELVDIVNAFVARAAASRSKAVAEIRSAIPLDQKMLDRLTQALEKVTGKALEVKVVVDPEVVGGIVARVGDTVFDGSVAHRFDLVRQALSA